jgi:hypothetical protein
VHHAGLSVLRVDARERPRHDDDHDDRDDHEGILAKFVAIVVNFAIVVCRRQRAALSQTSGVRN